MPLSPKRAGSVAYSAAMFLVVSMVAGLLVAGLAVPVAAMAGVGGRAAEKTVDDLPQAFETPPQPVKSKVTMANGKTLAYFFDQDRTYVKLDDIAPIMRQAQLAIEDHRYYQHGAIDVTGTIRALLTNAASGGVSQGGSSITQQYVKMVRITEAQLAGDEKGVKEAQDDTYARKIQELKYAIGLEKKLSKDQILERYLNIAYYGDGAYGVEAASQHYFDKHAKDLNINQAAMLAGLVQSPDADNPVQHPQAAIARRNVVLNRMAELNIITPQQLASATKAGFHQDKVQNPQNGCISSQYPFLCTYVYQSLLKQPSLGKTEQDRINTIKRGGLTIETAIDPKTQDAAQEAVSNYVGPKDPVIATMSMIQPGTGLIIGMAQSRPVMGNDAKKGETYYSYPAPPDLGGSSGGFQSGSTFKAITMAAALEAGVPPSKKYNAKSPMDFTGTTWKSCDGSFVLGDKHYAPKNSTGVNGVMDMRKAAKYSVNTYFLQLEHTIGLCPVLKMAEKLGVKLASGEPISESPAYNRSPSLTLGVANIAPLSLAEAYATFAARGIHCDPIIIDKITNADGKELKAPSANCKRVISEDVADGVNDILQGVMTGTGAPAALPDGRPEAGKTGTTNDNQAVWFAGYTPDLAGVASVAEDVTRKPFRAGHVRSGGLEYYHLSTGVTLQATGGGDAGAGIWKPAMSKALKDVDPSKFADYKNKDTAKMVDLPDVHQMSIKKATNKLEDAGFSVVPTTQYSDQPAGYFIGFSQYDGKLPKFSTIYAVYSAGPAPQPKKDKKSNSDNGGKKNKKSDNGGKNKKNDGGKKGKKGG
ncbi:penicillin-binding protein [Microlunatus elymi]|uniref:Penicillin-binding protein n=1 Tax=Microlunatus elymi TaxID=2596828 RepID=A0A516PV65_9ACTN|nr:transglycosylase domain-containing protein [Microlunatus elymi]QDP95088.1 penicillin-binding protein [Microlunatus elymi]